jgi:hypothetical protein
MTSANGTKRPIVVVRPVPVDNGMGSTVTVFEIGVRLNGGDWDPEYPPRTTLTVGEAWALAGMLSRATGLPIAGVDVTEAGETIQ